MRHRQLGPLADAPEGLVHDTRRDGLATSQSSASLENVEEEWIGTCRLAFLPPFFVFALLLLFMNEVFASLLVRDNLC